jgi:DNA-binding response OmpR family regulator
MPMKNVLLVEHGPATASMLERAPEEERNYATGTERVSDARILLERVKFNLPIADGLLPDGAAFDASDIAVTVDHTLFDRLTTVIALMLCASVTGAWVALLLWGATRIIAG